MKYILLLILLIPCQLFSQSFNNNRTREIFLPDDTLTLDTLSIVPNSVNLFYNNKLINDSLYSVDYVHSLLIPDKKISGKQITIYYRTFPVLFSKPYYKRDHKKYKFSTYEEPSKTKYSLYKQNRESILKDDRIDKRGNISRGLTIGNNQSASVNSNVNIQLSGKVTDNMNIMAALSDNNIPIQPDGYTQQIQEFDKVYIKLYNKKSNLIFGDYQINSPTGYFMQMNKQLLGVSAKRKFYVTRDKKDTLISSLNGAISKGKYHRYTFNGTEGNQGPYRLKGAENESFIIILSGSEKIYIDGKLLTRGEDNDYVIDYNTGELTFTPNQPITKDKRITVEFQYSEQNYSRFTLYSANEYRTENHKFWLNVYSEQDSKNQTLQQDLKEEHKMLLSEIGDSLENALVENVDSVEFSDEQVLYEKTDTTVNGYNYTIYQYSTNPDKAHYQLGFSYVGEKNGNYILIRSAANGKVYQWVAPENGVSQGNYEPVRLLITPKKEQLITMGTKAQITPTTKTFAEIAMSCHDLNTFSGLDDKDNVGTAVKLQLNQDILKNGENSGVWASTGYQYIDEKFNPVQRFRSVEFERDWNIKDASYEANEHLADFGLHYKQDKLGFADYNFNIMKKGNLYDALKNNLSGKLDYKGFHLDFRGSILNTEDSDKKTSFTRQYTTLAKDIAFLTIGIKDEMEDNQWTLKENDSLLGNSFFYHQYNFFTRNNDTTGNTFQLDYKNRKDFLPYDNKMKYSTLAEDISGTINLQANRNHTLKTIATYRTLKIINEDINPDKEKEHSAVGRIEHGVRLKKGLFNLHTTYEIGSGLEIKKEFSFIKVTNGQGVYKWTDYNNNSIKELDEFEVATFKDEANYIRVFTPTNDYIKAYSNLINQVFSIKPRNIWKKKDGIQGFLSKFENNFAYRISNKTTLKKVEKNLNPFLTNINDTSLISHASSYRNTLSYNKYSTTWGCDYFTQLTENKTLLLNGFTTNLQRKNGLKIRYRLIKQINLYHEGDIGTKRTESEFFQSKNYKISFQHLKNTIKWTPNLKTQVNIIYEYTEKNNILNIEGSTQHKTGAEFKTNILKDGNITMGFNHIKITYNYPTNTSIAYEMLQGLLPGNNQTWSLMFQKSLGSGLEIFISYNGRKTEEAKAIHTGNIQVRANF